MFPNPVLYAAVLRYEVDGKSIDEYCRCDVVEDDSPEAEFMLMRLHLLARGLSTRSTSDLNGSRSEDMMCGCGT